MKNILEFINRNTFDNLVGEIRFELDDESLKYFSIDEGNRVVYKSSDAMLRMGDHATQREDRPKEKGGDGEHINEWEVVNMFRYVWNDIVDMYYDGKFAVYTNRFIIENHSFLEKHNGKIVYNGARPSNKTLWAVFMIRENSYSGKLDIIVVTIFRGERLNHTRDQEKILIGTNGNVKQLNNY